MSKVLQRYEKVKSKVIVAIDDPSISLNNVRELISDVKDLVFGFKIGIPYILHHGLSNIGNIIKEFNEPYYIADLKLADIGIIMSLSAKLAGTAGFNGVIAHGIIGYEGSLKDLLNECNALGIDLYIVASMSHPGSLEIYDKVLDDVLNVIKKLRPTGVIAPATRPNVISYIREVLGKDIIILSPGVGAQGAKPGSALCAGADFEIVGRAITKSLDPVKAVNDIVSAQLKYLNEFKCSKVRAID